MSLEFLEQSYTHTIPPAAKQAGLFYPKDGVEKEKIIFCDGNDSCDCARTFGYLSDLPVIWGVIIIMRGGVMLYEKE